MLESVDMAIEMLNESEIRPGCGRISVQMAEFQQKGHDYVPKKKSSSTRTRPYESAPNKRDSSHGRMTLRLCMNKGSGSSS